MPFEVLSTFTKVEPDSIITLGSYRATVAGLARDIVAYAYKDKGAAHFSGDFEHLLAVYDDAADNASTFAYWVLSNDLGDVYGLYVADKDYLCGFFSRQSGGELRLQIRECNGGVLVSDYYVHSLDTMYYLKIKRDEAVGANGTLYTYIYSDASRTTLVDTISAALTEKQDFRYLFCASSSNSSTAGEQDGYCENLDLQEVVAQVFGAIV